MVEAPDPFTWFIPRFRHFFWALALVAVAGGGAWYVFRSGIPDARTSLLVLGVIVAAILAYAPSRKKE